ncbi:hypothetical protein J7F01_34885 [Streptomyces sp. ISL-22]|uniref:hypothetical protein n=1 Tax=unclassified Streptomyces TaxID=2593676 RepID=UPI001BE79DF3|nr:MULTISPECIES: hypothetical protein [unclassified Streptomyces]MBT2417563.1 hypothetical protein [Streptomyces sp. ISL-24]MBT2437256.1 hypothetical protein [Streptomyces sp. ISL-22]
MSARHTTRSHNRLLLTATACAAAAVLLRLLSPDGETEAAPEPTHSTTPTRSTHHKTTPSTPAPRPSTSPTRSTPHETPTASATRPDTQPPPHPQQPPAGLPADQ